MGEITAFGVFLILTEREIRNTSTMEQEVEEESCSRTGDVCVFEASATSLLRFDRDHVLLHDSSKSEA